MAGEDVHHDRKGQYMGSHDEYEDQSLRNGNNPFTPGTRNHLSDIRKAMDARVYCFKLAHGVASIGRHDTEPGDKKNTWKEAHSRDDSW